MVQFKRIPNLIYGPVLGGQVNHAQITNLKLVRKLGAGHFINYGPICLAIWIREWRYVNTIFLIGIGMIYVAFNLLG